jgi:Ca2+-binding RTX toxin-like protein
VPASSDGSSGGAIGGVGYWQAAPAHVRASTSRKDVADDNQGKDTIYGGHGDDILWGRKGDDSIYGSDGDHTIYGNNGQDSLRGERGGDSIVGGTGEDTIYISTGYNQTVEAADGETDAIFLCSRPDPGKTDWAVTVDYDAKDKLIPGAC